MRFTELLPYITPHRRALLGMLALLLCGSLLSLANPWMAGLFTASVLEEGELVPGTLQLLGLWLLLMVAAGLVAKKALDRGLMVKPWVKTSLAPGSQVVTDYLEKAGLQDALDPGGRER